MRIIKLLVILGSVIWLRSYVIEQRDIADEQLIQIQQNPFGPIVKEWTA